MTTPRDRSNSPDVCPVLTLASRLRPSLTTVSGSCCATGYPTGSRRATRSPPGLTAPPRSSSPRDRVPSRGPLRVGSARGGRLHGRRARCGWNIRNAASAVTSRNGAPSAAVGGGATVRSASSRAISIFERFRTDGGTWARRRGSSWTRASGGKSLALTGQWTAEADRDRPTRKRGRSGSRNAASPGSGVGGAFGVGIAGTGQGAWGAAVYDRPAPPLNPDSSSAARRPAAKRSSGCGRPVPPGVGRAARRGTGRQS